MELKDIELNKTENDDLLAIYNKVKETIGYLQNEINLYDGESN